MGISKKTLGALGGAAIGGLIGGPMGAMTGAGIGGSLLGGNEQQNANTVTRTEPNTFVAQYLPDYLGRAKSLSLTPYIPYAGQRIAGFSPLQTRAISGIGSLASESPIYGAGAKAVQDTAAGQYLDVNTNPYIQGTINKALGDVRGLLGSTFAGNQFGSSAHEEMLQRKGLEAIAPMLMQNYGAERERQMQAAQISPMMEQAKYQDMNALLGAGALQQQQEQDVLGAKYEDWLAAQNAPMERLGLLSNALNVAGGVGGGTSVASGPNPYAKNKLASGLGSAATTAGLLNMTENMNSPWANAAIGGAGLLGYFG